MSQAGKRTYENYTKEHRQLSAGAVQSLVLLVAWPSGKKGCKGVDFTKVTLKDMMDPEYRRKLAQGNIGVVQGEASGGIGSIDIDDDQGAEEFLALNPDLKDTLRTRGARGCNVWFYPEAGKCPAVAGSSGTASRGASGGYNGCQTIIAGVHPSGSPYSDPVRNAGHPVSVRPYPVPAGGNWPVHPLHRILCPSFYNIRTTDYRRTDAQTTVCDPL